MTMTLYDVQKRNAINIARHHKSCCIGESCNISLLLLAQLLEMAGVKLTAAELEEFV